MSETAARSAVTRTAVMGDLTDGHRQAVGDIGEPVGSGGLDGGWAGRPGKVPQRSVYLLTAHGADARFPCNCAQRPGRTEHAPVNRQGVHPSCAMGPVEARQRLAGR